MSAPPDRNPTDEDHDQATYGAFLCETPEFLLELEASFQETGGVPLEEASANIRTMIAAIAKAKGYRDV